jgi:hypothetical protein
MTDTANPLGAESLSESAAEQALTAAFTDKPAAPKPEAPEAPAAEAEAVEAPEDTGDELTPEDIEDEPPPKDDAAEFEIVVAGQTQRVSRQEIIELAQKGRDYTQKTMALADKYRQAETTFQQVQEMVQLAPLVAQDLATVKAFESQLQQFDKAIEQAGGWVQLATSDPLEYPKYQAQYNQLRNGYQTAMGALQHKHGELQQRQQAVSQETLQREHQKLTTLIPEWSDPQKYQAGAQELSQYLIKQGADPQAVASLTDAIAVSVARKAMLYDKLREAKKSKQLRSAPPVIKPGANVPSDNGRSRDQRVLQDIRKAGRQGNHSAQERAAIGLLNKTFKL